MKSLASLYYDSGVSLACFNKSGLTYMEVMSEYNWLYTKSHSTQQLTQELYKDGTLHEKYLKSYQYDVITLIMEPSV